MNNRTVIAEAGNVLSAAMGCLRSLGYTVSINEDGTCFEANSATLRLVAEHPLGLLGLVMLHEQRGDDWQPSEKEVDDFLSLQGEGNAQSSQRADVGEDLSEVLGYVREAARLLERADGVSPDAIEQAAIGAYSREATRIENLFHEATHETGNALAFMVHEIEVLLQRVGVKKKYSMFSNEEFDHVVLVGWSTTLIHELHKAHSSYTLSDLSALVKNLCNEWSALPSYDR